MNVEGPTRFGEEGLSLEFGVRILEMTFLLEIAYTSVVFVALYLLADFVSGLFHWAEDTLGADDTPIWGPLFAAPNSRHHSDPSAMLKIHWLRNNSLLVGACVGLAMVFWVFGALTWHVVVFAFFTGTAQQVHRFSHAPSARLPRFVRLLQRMHVLQDARHHWGHHRAPHLTRYCVVTPWLNPVLDRIKFWRVMDRLFVPIFGAPRRSDLCEKPWYRAQGFWA
ncbi:fatty acid desaturase CarF family protein [Jannaschia seohaensis]|uniref:Ubiquitin-conjugating enzyme E2 variant n=1 Tax=Jannaschia seohaensis TaxID=475081 RepID=A0A2Y9A1A3_9RHOB|nr:fatty acid desaturase CarF family protein [Jannaschia seohaensis]PWJ22043.1 ubiquitin-conjugating enzyme E2 variant [Jannaschia seohaensis]SSA38321.1 ubiquitin-conjugating enzyme E2 variant [Jannaschia seohaensis]